MKQLGIGLTILIIFFINSIKATSINIDSLFQKSPNKYYHTQINNRQDTIHKYFGNIESVEFHNQIDTLQLFIELNNLNKEQKSNYLNYLFNYLNYIEKPNVVNYFASGRYLSCLQFYPAIIEYAKLGRLSDLLNENKLLALKSLRLCKNEPAAKSFLIDYIYDNPDDVIRNIDEFSDAPYVNEVLMKLAAYSPLSAERYLGGFNTVNRIVKTIDDPIAKALVKLDSTKTNRHINFLFLNSVVNDNKIIDFASTISNNKIAFFKELCKLHANPNLIGKYSADREMSIISSDIMREINYYYSNGYKNNVNSIISSFNEEEIYLIFLYGYQNANTFSFSAYLQLIKERVKVPFTKDFYKNISKSDLENFIKTADQFKMTNEILSITDNSYKNELLAYLSNNEAVKMDFTNYLDEFKKNLIHFNLVSTNNSNTYKTNPIDNIGSPASKQNVVTLNDKSITNLQTNNNTKANSDEVKSTINTSNEFVNSTQDIASNNTTQLTTNSSVELKSLSLPTIDSKLELNNTNQKLYSKDEVVAINKNEVNAISVNNDAITNNIKAIRVPIVIRIRQDEKYTYEILKNIDNTLGNINYTANFLDKNYSKKVLNTIAEMHPDDIFRQVKNLQSKYWIKEILENATKQSPISYKRYLPNENHPVRYILSNSTDSTILMLNNLYSIYGYKSNLYSFIDDIITYKKSPESIDSICKSNKASFKEMISIITQKNCIGKYSLEKELENNSLTTVRGINDIVTNSDDVRFEQIKDYSAAELYVLMIYGEDELFKSSFNGIYNLFNQKLGEKNTFDFLENIDYLHFRTFLKILANFNRTEEFLNKMTADQRLELISKMVKNLENEKYNPSEVIYVAEAIPGFKLMNDRAVINTMIRKEFERLQNENAGTGMLLYGLLASIIEKDAVAEVDWYKEIKNDFQLPNIDRIAINTLKNNEVVVQQHYFYNDDDGKSSYNNFIATFKSMSNWEIITKETYVQINSTAGNKVIILANKPEFEQNGINDIQKYLSANQLVVTVVVHRGHSFHTEKTLSIIPSTTKLLIVGSCGGYYKLPVAIERAPDAQIVSTKQIGTMRVNDPIIKTICEDIRLNKDIIWSDFWTIIENLTGKTAMFYDYVPPNKNLGSLFLNAYYSAIEKSTINE